MENKSIPDKWFIIPILILLINLFYWLIDKSKLLFYFPLDFHNDLSSYMAQLHFLKVCGFHSICSYWYNGFNTFTYSPPGWYFFTYPLYLLFNDVKIATYVSMIFILVLGLLFFYKFGRLAKLSITKRIAFFVLFFANASAIGNFIRLGRPHELLAWVFFIVLFFTFYFYIDKKIDWKFYLLSIIYAFIIITYQSIGVLAAVSWAGFLFSRDNIKEALKTVIAGIVGLSLSAFWLVPFVLGIFKESSIPELKQGEWIWYIGKNSLFTNIAIILVPFIFLVLFYFYYKNNNPSKKYILFFSPVVILSFLFLIRVTPFFPIFDQLYPDPIVHFIAFYAIFILLKLDITDFTINKKKLLFYSLIIISLLSVSVNIIHTPRFVVNSELDKEFISYVPDIDNRFILFVNGSDGILPKAFYSYAATKNVNSISGWYPQEKPYSYIKKMDDAYTSLYKNDCDSFKDNLIYFNTTEVLASNSYCDAVKNCGLVEKKRLPNSCFYVLE